MFVPNITVHSDSLLPIMLHYWISVFNEVNTATTKLSAFIVIRRAPTELVNLYYFLIN